MSALRSVAATIIALLAAAPVGASSARGVRPRPAPLSAAKTAVRPPELPPAAIQSAAVRPSLLEAAVSGARAAAGSAASQLAKAGDAIAAVGPAGDPAAIEAASARTFDGKAAASPNEAGDFAPAAPAAQPLPGYLAAADPETEPWLGSVLERMERSKTARAVLRKVEALASQRGRPLLVVVAPIGGASGLYNYDTGVVTIDSKLRAEDDLRLVAGVFTHELQHALQFGTDLPVMAFEMEVESFIVEFRVQQELGYKPPAGSMDRSAFRRFKNDPERFIAWLNKEYYPKDLAIIGKAAGELEDRLLEARKSVERGLRWHESRLKKVNAVLERMKQTGQPDHAIEQYRLDEVAPVEANVRLKKRELGWLDHDLAIMRDPVAAKRYKKYAAGVLRRARAYHKTLNGR